MSPFLSSKATISSKVFYYCTNLFCVYPQQNITVTINQNKSLMRRILSLFYRPHHPTSALPSAREGDEAPTHPRTPRRNKHEGRRGDEDEGHFSIISFLLVSKELECFSTGIWK